MRPSWKTSGTFDTRMGCSELSLSRHLALLSVCIRHKFACERCYRMVKIPFHFLSTPADPWWPTSFGSRSAQVFCNLRSEWFLYGAIGESWNNSSAFSGHSEFVELWIVFLQLASQLAPYSSREKCKHPVIHCQAWPSCTAWSKEWNH